MPFSTTTESTRPPNRLTTSLSAPPSGRTRAMTCPFFTFVPGLYPNFGYEPRGLGHHLEAGVASEQDALVSAHHDRDGAEDAPDDGRRYEGQQRYEGQPPLGTGNAHQPVELVRGQRLVHRLLAKQGFLHDPLVVLGPLDTRHPCRRRPFYIAAEILSR